MASIARDFDWFINHLWEKSTTDLVPLVVATVAQVIVGCVYYGMVVNTQWLDEMERDKGVRSFRNIIFRYGNPFSLLASVVCGLLKSLAILTVMDLMGHHHDSLCMFLQTAFFVWVVIASTASGSLWEQRPWKLIAMTLLGELIETQFAGYMLYSAKYSRSAVL
jgi:hypothetical protein